MNKLTKRDKILLTLYKMSDGEKNPFFFEDVIVTTFLAFPKDFSLPRYEQYPDSDIFRRELYFNLRPKGLIRIAKRKCILTDLGMERSKKLLNVKIEKKVEKETLIKELNSIISLKGFQLFIEQSYDDIVDQDLYDLLKISVKTKTLEIVANISKIKDTIERLHNQDKIMAKKIQEYFEFLTNKFSGYLEDIK